MSQDFKKEKKGFSISHLAHKFKTLALIGGFAFDLYILPPINTGKFWWVGPMYIGLVFFCIFMRQLFRRFINNGTFYMFYKLHSFFFNTFSFFVSFFMGSLLAYSLIYYSSLSDIFSVWPMMILILVAIILNETLKDKIFDVVIFMMAINFYFILNTPIFFKEVSDVSFYLALGISFVANFVIIKTIKGIYREAAHNMFYIGALFLIPASIYGLYILKYLPAVPLKLGDSGFYTYINKSNDNYYREAKGITYSKEYFILKDAHIKKQDLENDDIYFYSSVISPKDAEIKSIISHSWEKWNPKTNKWEGKFIFSFPIFGDRVEGYRGFSQKPNIEKGEWRVRVLSDERVVGIKKIFIE